MAVERQSRWAARLLVSAVVGAAALLRADRADACSCGDPYANELLTGNGLIPVNAGILWWFVEPLGFDPTSLVTIERIEGETYVLVSASVERFQDERRDVYIVRPESGWAVGERYRISAGVDPSAGRPELRSRTVEIEITPALGVMPLEISTSAAEQRQVQLRDNRGSCSSDRDAAVVEVSAIGPEDMPVDLLYFTTYLDGVLWRPTSHLCSSIEPGSSWTGRSTDRLVAVCDGADGKPPSLPEGQHTVRMEARLPGTDLTFETPEQLVELRCDASEPGVPYGAAPARNPVSISGSAEGCAISAASARGSTPAFAVMSLLAALILGARRRLTSRHGVRPRSTST
jgi:hypothetical protein